jgi:hypothetical protein
MQYLIGGFEYIKYNFKKFIINSIYNTIGIAISIYSAIYIFNSRNGIIMVIIIGLLFFVFLAIKYLQEIIKNKNNLYRIYSLMILIVLGLLISSFSIHQYKNNSSWHTIIDDVQIAIQIDKFQNWKKVWEFGYPESAPGRVVVGNTYERVAWATVGVTRLIPENPLGIGILNNAFPLLLSNKFGEIVDDRIPATHSGWIDLTLAFGIPGLLLLSGPLILTAVFSLISSRKDKFDGYLIVASISLLLMFLIGELASGHGLEIFIYLIAFLAALSFLRHTQE